MTKAGRQNGKHPVRAQKAIENRIYFVRGLRVMLDEDLAELYGVATKVFNQAVKRHKARFPLDFGFRLTRDEAASLRSQIVTSNEGRGGRRYPPMVFTEHGAIMAASILNSPRAVDASVFVVRAFVKLREVLATHRALAKKLSELEAKIGAHDQEIQLILETLRRMMQPAPHPKRPIGFAVKEKKGRYKK